MVPLTVDLIPSVPANGTKANTAPEVAPKAGQIVGVTTAYTHPVLEHRPELSQPVTQGATAH